MAEQQKCFVVASKPAAELQDEDILGLDAGAADSGERAVMATPYRRIQLDDIRRFLLAEEAAKRDEKKEQDAAAGAPAQNGSEEICDIATAVAEASAPESVREQQEWISDMMSQVDAILDPSSSGLPSNGNAAVGESLEHLRDEALASMADRKKGAIPKTKAAAKEYASSASDSGRSSRERNQRQSFQEEKLARGKTSKEKWRRGSRAQTTEIGEAAAIGDASPDDSHSKGKDRSRSNRRSEKVITHRSKSLPERARSASDGRKKSKKISKKDLKAAVDRAISAFGVQQCQVALQALDLPRETSEATKETLPEVRALPASYDEPEANQDWSAPTGDAERSYTPDNTPPPRDWMAEVEQNEIVEPAGDQPPSATTGVLTGLPAETEPTRKKRGARGKRLIKHRTCFVCDAVNQHSPYGCAKYQAMQVPARMSLAKAKRRCYNCLGMHPRSVCVKPGCVPCNGEKHHGLLCPLLIEAAMVMAAGQPPQQHAQKNAMPVARSPIRPRRASNTSKAWHSPRREECMNQRRRSRERDYDDRRRRSSSDDRRGNERGDLRISAGGRPYRCDHRRDNSQRRERSRRQGEGRRRSSSCDSYEDSRRRRGHSRRR